MLKKQLSVVFSLFIFVMLLPLCGAYSQVIHSLSPGEQQIILNELDAGIEVQLPGDQLLLIELESNPSTGYTWEVLEIDNRLLRLTDTEFYMSSQEHVTIGTPLLGAPQTQVLRFAGLDTGMSKLVLAHRRSWERDIPPLDTYTIYVDVQGAFNGSYAPLKEQGDAFVDPPPATRQDSQILTLPTSYNWCDHNVCTPVKDQGSCGSCWAFGTVAPLESAIRRTDGATRDISEQYLVSCNSEGWGCNGGWWAHDYHLSKKPAGQPEAGSVYEANFPYTATKSPCNPPYTSREKITGWAYIAGHSIPSVAAVKQAIYDHGPVAVVVCVNNDFQRYSSGIFTGASCTDRNHGVVLVGWNDADQYWVLRNSWGTNWGENGYMRIRYGVSQVGYAANYINYSSTQQAGSIQITIEPADARSAGAQWRRTGTSTWRNSGATESNVPVGTHTIEFKEITGWTKPANRQVTVNAGQTATATGTYLQGGSDGWEEHFRQTPSNWLQDSGSWSVVQNEYWSTQGRVELFNTSTYNRDYSNLDFSARVKRTGSAINANSIILRAGGSMMPDDYPSNGYFFQYVNDGQFSVWKRINGVDSALRSWRYSSAISRNDWNTLRAVVNGSNLQYYINGTLVWEGTDSSLSTGRVGVAMYSAQSNGETFHVDWARLGTPGSQTGGIQVTIEPADARSAGAQWRRTGTSTWRNSGATESNVPVGTHTIEFKEITGWTKPANRQVTVNAGQTATATGTYIQQTGGIQITIEPADARSAGAQWRRTGTSTWRNSGATESNVPVGTHTIEFKEITGWTKPANRQVTVSAGQTATATATYGSSVQTGSIRVTIEPAGAREAGAQWRRANTTTGTNTEKRAVITPSRGERPPIDLQSVPQDVYEKGIIKIKLMPHMAHVLRSEPIVSGASGYVMTGHQGLDELNRAFSVSRYEPLFEPLYDTNSKTGEYRERHRAWGFHLWFKLVLPENEDVIQAVSQFQALADVEIAGPEFKKQLIGNVQNGVDTESSINDPRLNWTPNDPRFGEQWHYKNTGQQGGTSGADISLPHAWDLEKGRADVIVAIIDGGIDYNHADLAANMWSGRGHNFVNDSATIVPHNHGTHVAGTVAAVNHNGTGVAGVAGGSGNGDGVRLMSCQVFTSSGSGGFHLAPVYAADNGAAISQNSWGYTRAGVYEQEVLDAIDYFNTNGGGDALDGGITIFAAGNDNSEGQWYPGYYAGAFSVAATNNQDRKSYYSNYGNWVDISAPGGETNQVTSRGVLSTTNNNTYSFYQGTSMACPHVSGVAALMVSQGYGRLRADQIADVLRDTADDHYAVNSGYIGKLGTGRLNALAAVQGIQELNPWFNSGATESNVPVGTHTIEFKEIAGWIQPANRQVTVNAGQTATATGTYNVQEPGAVQVTIEPADARSAGAQWRRTGTSTWRNSGATESNVPVGTHTIEFKEITGWTKPANRQVTVSSGQTATTTGTYTQRENLGACLDNTDLTWTTGGHADWFCQTEVAHYGGSSAQSGTITHNQSTRLETTVNGPGRIGFHWKVSSESGYDYLNFFINNTRQDRISGNVDWREAGFDVPAGSHTLRWDYTKDGSVNSGSDAGWVDRVIWAPASQTGGIQVTIEPADARSAGAQWRRTGTSTWRNSGATESNVPVGTHTIEFKEITGWTKPANVQVTVSSGQTATATGTYRPASSSTAERTITGSRVCIRITPARGVVAWGLDEELPVGLVPEDITGPNGTWSGSNRKITWFSTGSDAVTVCYTGIGSPGNYEVSGTATFSFSEDDREDVLVAGSAIVTVGGTHPGDSNSDWNMIRSEAVGYIAGWQQGTNPMNYAIRGAYLWQNGEEYHRLPDAQEPMCWVPVALGSTSPSMQPGASGAVRAIQGSNITIEITPEVGAGTGTWGYEELLPQGLVPENIEGPNSSWNEGENKITWWGSVTSEEKIVLRYTAKGPNGTYTVSGRVNFDGADGTVTGPAEIVLGEASKLFLPGVLFLLLDE